MGAAGIGSLVIVVLAITICQINAKIFDKCSLARALHHYGVPYDELADWLCLTEHESSYNTKAINPINSDGSKDWGLFQINDRYWCKPSDGRQSANICRLSCDMLLSNEIKEAVNCAMNIRRQQGFSAWVAWNVHCQGAKPSIEECF